MLLLSKQGHQRDIECACDQDGKQLVKFETINWRKGVSFIIYNLSYQLCKQQMGSIQSKIKNGYSTKKVQLLQNSHSKPSKSCRMNINCKEQQNSFDLDNTNSSEHQQPDCPGQNISKGKKPSSNGQHQPHSYFQYPYSSIGLVACELGEQKVVGTGCIIGANFVLTCAHNVWAFREKKLGRNISFSPMYGAEGNGHSFTAKNVFFCEELRSNELNGDEQLFLDFAIIELECQNIQAQFGALALSFEEELNTEEEVALMGYARMGKSLSFCELEGVADVHDGLMFYEMSPMYGMSGAPILKMIDGTLTVIGIHIFCRQRNGKVQKGGIKFTMSMMEKMKKWCLLTTESIDLREKEIGKQGLKHLSKHKWINLTSLNLSRNNLQSNCAKYFRKGNWKTLQQLDLGGNQIGPEGAQGLAQAGLTALVTLNLWGNMIGKKGAKHISEAQWPSLTNLNLYNNAIEDEGVSYLIAIKFIKLNNLNLGKNMITDAGGQKVVDGQWHGIMSLNLWGNQLKGCEFMLKTRLQQQFRSLKYLYF